MTKAAIIQSNYIPWKGYFDIIQDVDTFVFLDDAQMTKRDWRTRNRIKTAKGVEWLSVPVKGGRHQRICDVAITDNAWQRRHLKTLVTNYSRAPHFEKFEMLLEWLYQTEHQNLSEFNQKTTKLICRLLNIEAEFLCATELDVPGSKSEKLINICQEVGATVYLSGPSARDYICEEQFIAAGIELRYKSYPDYPEYPQLFPPFRHDVSIIDLLFNCGPDSAQYVWDWSETTIT